MRRAEQAASGLCAPDAPEGPDGAWARAGAEGADVDLPALVRALCRAVADDVGGTVQDAAAGMEAAATVLWSRFLRFDVGDPCWADRDRFVLSSGRFQPLLRALLRLTGHGEVPRGCAFGWHPAVETAAGPPGQGFATAVGMAMAERALAARYGRTLVDHRTWVLACEGDLAAGVSLEAAALAGQMGLDKLVVLSGAPRDGGAPEAVTRFLASGWAVRRVDAGDADAIAAAVAGALRAHRPTLIACQSGAPGAGDGVGRADAADGAGRVGAADGAGHAGAGDGAGRVGAGDGAGRVGAWDGAGRADARDAEAAWLGCGRRGAGARRSWLRRLVRHRQQAEFERTRAGLLLPGWGDGWERGWRGGGPPDAATLEAGRHGLAVLGGLLPELITLHSTAGAPLLDGAGERGGDAPARLDRYWPCGVQEHGMAALANGLSLHGGLRPVLAAAFVSIDRMRPALRLGALMGQPVIYLLTGDGPAGADDAGSRPVEQLASLRAMPEVMVFRPADAAEVEACWALALRHDRAPSLIALSSQREACAPASLPASRAASPAPSTDPGRRAAAEAGCARGGYRLEAAPGPARATLVATGPEVAVALRARTALEAEGIAVAVVSLPCWELFAAQPASYREEILGKVPRIGIEAASGFGWERWLGPDGVFIGMDGFGASAPADTLHRQSGITPDAVAARVRRRLGLAAP